MADSPLPSVLSEIPLDIEERLLWLIEREEELAQIIARDLTKIIRTTYNEFLATLTPEEQLTASGDIEQLGDIVPRWRMAIGRNVQPYLEQVYLSGAISAYSQAPGTQGFTEAQAGAWADVVNTVAVEYSREMTNRLVGVGETAYNMIRGKVTKAIESGASNDQLRNDILDVTQFSEFRADVVARTEVQFAYANGNWQASQALGQYGPVEKEWLAAGDGRVRRSHAAISGTRMPINEPFQLISGAQLMYPHDPSAPARETIQCRCVLLEFYAGDVRPDGSIVGQDPLPGQEREMQNLAADQSIMSTQQAVQSARQTGLPPGNDFSSEVEIVSTAVRGAAKAQAEMAREIIELMDTVHRLPINTKTRTIQVRFSGAKKGKGGHFKPQTRGAKPRYKRGMSQQQWDDLVAEYNARPVTSEILITQTFDPDGQAFALVHELGHRFDYDGIRTYERGFRSYNIWRGEIAQDLQSKYGREWLEHLDEIADVETRSLLQLAKLTRDAESAARFTAKSGIDYRTYFYSIEEVWARAYSQWVAETTQHPRLLSGLKPFIEKGMQYSPEEYAQVKPLVEAVLRARGAIS